MSKTRNHNINGYVVGYIAGCVITAIIVIVGYESMKILDMDIINPSRPLSEKQLGNDSVKVMGTTTWDNYCRVEYVGMYSNNNGVEFMTNKLPLSHFYDQHCPRENNPWIIQTGDEPSYNPPFKLLTGGTDSDPTYDFYAFDKRSHRYELVKP